MENEEETEREGKTIEKVNQCSQSQCESLAFEKYSCLTTFHMEEAFDAKIQGCWIILATFPGRFTCAQGSAMCKDVRGTGASAVGTNPPGEMFIKNWDMFS